MLNNALESIKEIIAGKNSEEKTGLIIPEEKQEESPNYQTISPSASSDILQSLDYGLNTLTLSKTINSPPSTTRRFQNFLRSCCHVNPTNEKQVSSWQSSLLEKLKVGKKFGTDVIEAVKIVTRNQKIKAFIYDASKKMYQVGSNDLLGVLTADYLVTEIMEALEYEGNPTDEQFAFAKIIAQIIGLLIITLSILRRLFQDKELEDGMIYHTLNVFSEFTFTLIVVLYLDSLAQPGEMPNDAKTMSELAGLCLAAFLIGLMSYQTFRNKIYELMEKWNRPIPSLIKKTINTVFEGISAASTAEMVIYVLQLFLSMVVTKSETLDPYSPPMNFTRWSGMALYFIARAAFEIRPRSQQFMSRIGMAEMAALNITSLAYYVTNFMWLNDEFESTGNTHYENLALSFLLSVAFIVFVLACFKSCIKVAKDVKDKKESEKSIADTQNLQEDKEPTQDEKKSSDQRAKTAEEIETIFEEESSKVVFA